MMTQDDKAKAYDEMVQRVKELHETGNFLTKKQMEIICPELAESEDERIRKAILANYKGDYHIPVFNGVTREDCIAYLEKQKERLADNSKTLAKSERVIKAARSVLNNWLDGTDCPDVSGDFAELEHAIREYDGEEKQKEPHYTKRNALFDKCVENCDPEVMKRVSDEIDEMLEKEQKPDDDSLDDPKFLKGFDIGREVQRIFDEQKPDEIDGKALLHVSNKSYDIGFRDGVASVKPAEWSEEDGDNLCRIMSVLEDNDSDWKELSEWLKSLRPQTHWKPSEEQMKALKDVSDREFFSGNGATLRVLYNDLKKL